MFKIMCLILFLTLTACGQKSTSVPTQSQGFEYKVVSNSSAPTKRLYYFHGMYQSIQEIESNMYYMEIINSFAQAGYEVVLIQYPIPTHDDLAGTNGPEFVKRIQDYVRQVDQGLPAVAVKRTGGFSLGGLMAIMASSIVGADFTFANETVTKVSQLEEFADLDTSFMDVTSFPWPPTLLATWGTADLRVNYHLSEQIFASNPNTIAFPGAEHETTQPMVDTLENWFSTHGIL